jgi:energy-coupling factor transporter transmembrane protein EcfT
MTSLLERADSLLNKIIPINPSCPLAECTAVKAYAIVALLSIATSALRSWSSFVGTIVFEALLGLLVLWLCRNCHKKWAWALVVVTSLVPILLFIAFVLGLAIVAVGSRK